MVHLDEDMWFGISESLCIKAGEGRMVRLTKLRKGSIQQGPLMCCGRESELCVLCSISCGDAETVLKRRATQLSLESWKKITWYIDKGLDTNTAEVGSHCYNVEEKWWDGKWWRLQTGSPWATFILCTYFWPPHWVTFKQPLQLMTGCMPLRAPSSCQDPTTLTITTHEFIYDAHLAPMHECLNL